MDVTCSSPHPVGIEQCARVLLATTALLGGEDGPAVTMATVAALLRQRAGPRPPVSLRQADPLPAPAPLQAWKIDVGYQIRRTAFGLEVLHLSVLFPHAGPGLRGTAPPTAAPGAGALTPCDGCRIHPPSLSDPDLVLHRALLPLPSARPGGRAAGDTHASELAVLLDLLSDALLTPDPSDLCPCEGTAPMAAMRLSLDPDRFLADLAALGEEVGRVQTNWRGPQQGGVAVWCEAAAIQGPLPCLEGLLPDSALREPMLLFSLKRRSRVRTSAPFAGSGTGLTPREVLVARLLSERRSNQEIAAALGISPHTARHHTEQVLIKLGLHSRDDVWDRLRGSP